MPTTTCDLSTVPHRHFYFWICNFVASAGSQGWMREGPPLLRALCLVADQKRALAPPVRYSVVPSARTEKDEFRSGRVTSPDRRCEWNSCSILEGSERVDARVLYLDVARSADPHIGADTPRGSPLNKSCLRRSLPPGLFDAPYVGRANGGGGYPVRADAECRRIGRARRHVRFSPPRSAFPTTLKHNTVTKMNAPGKIPSHGSLLIVVCAW